MDNVKCITFDKAAQESLPEHIKAKMKADREIARAKRDVRDMLVKDLERWNNSMGFRQWIYCHKEYELEYMVNYKGDMHRNDSTRPVMNTDNWMPATKQEIIDYYEKYLLK